ncbi:MAG: hypothetical protein ABSH20_25690, partial [Tepidisphaeraceae bacterium]
PGLGKGQLAMAYRKPDPKAKAAAKPIAPAPGEPLLLVCALGMPASDDPALPLIQASTENGPEDRQGKAQTYDRLAINTRANESTFRVLLIPIRSGEALPQVTFDAASGTAKIQFKDQTDEITFNPGPDHRTKVTVSRDGKAILAGK